MSKVTTKRRGRPGLTLLALCLLMAGALHSAQLVSTALATPAAPGTPPVQEESPADLVAALTAREEAVAQREAAVTKREQGLRETMARAETQLSELSAAETRLNALVGKLNSAAQSDVDQLTAVYAAMKPKEAAELFSEMAPEFAAGFLAAMPTDRAAAILSEIEPRLAYSFSVLLAGRNANLRAPDQGS